MYTIFGFVFEEKTEFPRHKSTDTKSNSFRMGGQIFRAHHDMHGWSGTPT